MPAVVVVTIVATVVATAVSTAVAAVAAASWMTWLKFVHVGRWHEDGDQ
jgi:hypothetical protein